MKCPGQDTQYWKEGAIFDVSCPKCGGTVEFYKDDTNRRCPACGHRFVNPNKDFGCAAYCQFAEQCLGTLPEEFTGKQESLLKDKVAVAAKRYYKTNFARIGALSRIARHAENIGKSEGGNLAVILCAVFLRDIGSTVAAAADLAAIRTESLRLASSILMDLKAKPSIIEQVTAIIEEQPAALASREYAIITDAAEIARGEEMVKEGLLSSKEMPESMRARLHTAGGRQLAAEIWPA